MVNDWKASSETRILIAVAAVGVAIDDEVIDLIFAWYLHAPILVITQLILLRSAITTFYEFFS